MISALFVKDPVYQEEIDDSSSDVDDSFTCRTDQTTVRVSNVRRVTFTGAMDDATETADQLIQRLIADVSDHSSHLALLSMLNAALQFRLIQPVNAVRNLHGFWRYEGVELSEEIFHALERFSGIRRHEFVNALALVVEHTSVQQQGAIGTAQDASPSSSSSLTDSVGGASSTNLLENSGAASTAKSNVSAASSLASDSVSSSTTVLPNSDETLSTDGAASTATSLLSNEGASIVSSTILQNSVGTFSLDSTAGLPSDTSVTVATGSCSNPQA